MAFNKRFFSTYKSMNNDSYTLEFWCDGWPSGSTSEINLGPDACVINYETETDEKFTPIIASSMEIPIIVSNSTIDTFITELRQTYEEKEVYVHLYNDHDNTKPLWSGFILMDLTQAEDVSLPYIVKIKAVDGLSLLKDYDFVQDGAVLPYEKSETWYGVYSIFTYWITQILSKTGCALTTQGASQNYTFQTSVNWYNNLNTGTAAAQDPLRLTQCKMDSFYKIDEDGNYEPKSFYFVLNEICKSWGMRVVYWNHCFNFVQISQYQTNESGTIASPINITTNEYFYTGSVSLNQPYIGSLSLARYDLDFENATSSYGLQKLAGTQYNNYPVIKEAKANFQVIEDQNYFNGFPLLDTTYTIGADVLKTTDLATLNDAYLLDGWYCQIPLMFATNGIAYSASIQYDMKVCWTIRAKETSSATWQKMYLANNTSFSTAGWNTYNEAQITGGTPYYYINEYLINNINIGNSQRTIFDSGTLPNSVIPTNSSFIGEWEFEFLTYSKRSTSAVMDSHGGIQVSGSNNPLGQFLYPYLSSQSFNYSNIANNTVSPPFEGLFVPVVSGAIGTNTNQFKIKTSTSDSYIIDKKDLFFGESNLIDGNSSLRVWNGSAFVFTDFAGEWGINTISGNLSFVKLLLTEIINNQANSSVKMSVTSALSETNKEESGKPKFLNPIARLTDLDGKKYVMLRSTFNTAKDEWNGEWFQVTYNSITTTTNQQSIPGRNTGSVTGGGFSGTNTGQTQGPI